MLPQGDLGLYGTDSRSGEDEVSLNHEQGRQPDTEPEGLGLTVPGCRSR